MLSIIISFLFLFGIFFFGIKAFREMTDKEKWHLTKYVGYATVCAVLATVAMTVFVLLF